MLFYLGTVFTIQSDLKICFCFKFIGKMWLGQTNSKPERTITTTTNATTTNAQQQKQKKTRNAVNLSYLACIRFIVS